MDKVDKINDSDLGQPCTKRWTMSLKELASLPPDTQAFERIQMDGHNLHELFQNDEAIYWKAYVSGKHGLVRFAIRRLTPETQENDIDIKMQLTVRDAAQTEMFKSTSSPVLFPKSAPRVTTSWNMLLIADIKNYNFDSVQFELTTQILKPATPVSESQPQGDGAFEEFVLQDQHQRYGDSDYDDYTATVQIICGDGSELPVPRSKLIEISDIFKKLLEPDPSGVELGRLVLSDIDGDFLQTLSHYVWTNELIPGLTTEKVSGVRRKAKEYKIDGLVTLCESKNLYDCIPDFYW